MTFEEILDHAIAMLQRRGRLTYSTLKRQFQLDDAALDDLKNELIEGQRLAVDERGTVLVWIGTAPLAASMPLPAAPLQPPISGAASPSAQAHTSDAERRQLTVLFCDLVDSTPACQPTRPRRLTRGRTRLSRGLRQGDPAL